MEEFYILTKVISSPRGADIDTDSDVCLSGISGAVNSIAPTPSHIVTTALDRLVRLHSISSPAKEAGAARDDSPKPSVLDKLFWKFTPTVVCWDGESIVDKLPNQTSAEDDEEMEDADEDDVWDGMDAASDHDNGSDGSEDRPPKNKRRKQA